jgi:hypothetical protein
MSFSSLSSDGLVSSVPIPTDFDYMNNGVGMAELERIGAQTASALIAGGAYVAMIRTPSGQAAAALWVSPNETIAAVWGGEPVLAAVLASVVVHTIIAEERAKPANTRVTAYYLANSVVQRVTEKLLNGGDPAICQINFRASLDSWKAVYPVIRVPAGYTSTGWCERDLVFGPVFGSTEPCQLISICKWLTGPSGVAKAVAADPPPAGAPLGPSAASSSTAQPPPTHAELDAAAASDENARELTEFATYMAAMTQGRDWLTLALGIPKTAKDDELWRALGARGIAPGEALDWFNGCNADLDCFRQRMNLALGEADQRAEDRRTKLIVGVAVLGAALFAWRVYRGGGK